MRWLQSKGVREGAYVRLDASRVHVAIASQARLPPNEVQDVLDRLRRAGCIREVGRDILIAANDRLVMKYATYLDLKRRYQPNDRIPAEAQTVSAREKRRAVQRLLKAAGTPSDDEGGSALSIQCQQYADLQRLFESE